MKMFYLESDKEVQNVLSQSAYALIQFSATWCGPCRDVSPKVKTLLGNVNNNNWSYIYCDVDKVPEFTKQSNVRKIPCFCIYDRNSGSITNKVVSSDIQTIQNLCVDVGMIEMQQKEQNKTYLPPTYY